MRYWPFCLVTQCSYLCKTRQKRLRGRQQFILSFFNLTTLKTRWYPKLRYNRLFTTVPTPWSFHMRPHFTSGMEPLVLYTFSLKSQLPVTTLLETRLIERCATLCNAVIQLDFCLNSVVIDVNKRHGDELSLHGLKMKRNIKLNFASNLVSSRHN